MKEQEDIFNFLQKRKIETPTKDYFDGLVDQILEKESNTKVISIQRKVLVWTTSVAAVLLVAFLLINGSPDQSTDVFAELDNISTEELLAYMDDNIDEFETELIVENLTDEEVDELDEIITSELTEVTYLETKEEISFEEVSPSELDDYLDLEDLDLDDLENDFI